MSAGRAINTKSKEWGTPQKYVDAVKEFFGGEIDLDPCSNEYSIVNALVEYRLPYYDGLQASWDYPRIYVNPPYGRDKERDTTIYDWLKQCAWANIRYHSQVLALIPVATNTKHWKQFVFGNASMICFLRDTRLRFLENGQDVGKGAPMACAMVYWGINENVGDGGEGTVEYLRRRQRFKHIFSQHGTVIDITELIK